MGNVKDKLEFSNVKDKVNNAKNHMNPLNKSNQGKGSSSSSKPTDIGKNANPIKSKPNDIGNNSKPISNNKENNKPLNKLNNGLENGVSKAAGAMGASDSANKAKGLTDKLKNPLQSLKDLNKNPLQKMKNAISQGNNTAKNPALENGKQAAKNIENFGNKLASGDIKGALTDGAKGAGKALNKAGNDSNKKDIPATSSNVAIAKDATDAFKPAVNEKDGLDLAKGGKDLAVGVATGNPVKVAKGAVKIGKKVKEISKKVQQKMLKRIKYIILILFVAIIAITNMQALIMGYVGFNSAEECANAMIKIEGENLRNSLPYLIDDDMKAEIEKLYVDWDGAIESEVSPGTLIPQKGVLAGTYQKVDDMFRQIKENADENQIFVGYEVSDPMADFWDSGKYLDYFIPYIQNDGTKSFVIACEHASEVVTDSLKSQFLTFMKKEITGNNWGTINQKMDYVRNAPAEKEGYPIHHDDLTVTAYKYIQGSYNEEFKYLKKHKVYYANEVEGFDLFSMQDLADAVHQKDSTNVSTAEDWLETFKNRPEWWEEFEEVLKEGDTEHFYLYDIYLPNLPTVHINTKDAEFTYPESEEDLEKSLNMAKDLDEGYLSIFEGSSVEDTENMFSHVFDISLIGSIQNAINMNELSKTIVLTEALQNPTVGPLIKEKVHKAIQWNKSWRTYIKTVSDIEGLESAGENVAVALYNFLTKQLGFTKAGACGALGNIQQESSLCVTADNGLGHFGLVQWGGGRLNALKTNYPATYTKLSGQLSHMKDELNGNYSDVAEVCKTTNNLEEATKYWQAHYEVVDDGTDDKRLGYAQYYYDNIENIIAASQSRSGVALSNDEISNIMKTLEFKYGDKQKQAVLFALKAVGSAYSNNNRYDENAFDCSSLSYRAYALAGGKSDYGCLTSTNCSGVDINIGGLEEGAQQSYLKGSGCQVSPNDMEPGDLIYFYTLGGNEKCDNACHVMMYVGNGMVVNAAGTDEGVKYQEVWWEADGMRLLAIYRPLLLQ